MVEKFPMEEEEIFFFILNLKMLVFLCPLDERKISRAWDLFIWYTAGWELNGRLATFLILTCANLQLSIMSASHNFHCNYL